VQMVSMHLFPTLVVVFLLGMLTTWVNQQGAVAGIIIGFLLGLGQMIMSLAADPDACSKRFFKWECMHFNHFAIFLAGVVAIVSCLVSLLFPPPSSEQLSGKTVWTLSDEYAAFEDADGSGIGGEAAMGSELPGRSCSGDEVKTSGSLANSKQAVSKDDGAISPTAMGRLAIHSLGDCKVSPSAMGHPVPPQKLGNAISPPADKGGERAVEAEQAENITWTRHDGVNLAVASTVFVLMAANLWIWA